MRRVGTPSASSEEEVDWLRQLQRGERSAQARLFREHVQFVAHVARAGGARNDLDDVVQETFLSAFDSVHALEDARAMRAWLARITVRQIARRRRFRAWLGLFGRLAEEQNAWEQLLDPSSPPDVVAEIRSVGRVLDGLGPDERLAWVLRHWHGLTLEETSEACHTSLATLKRRLARAEGALEAWRRTVDR